MNLTAKGFIENWNKEHHDFQFLLNGPDEKPFEISIRYPVDKYYGYFINNFRGWSDFACGIDEASRGLMIVTSGRELYSRGIIDIKVACQSPDFTPEIVTEVLIWIGETLSPSRIMPFETRVSER